jgi:hypothetical protein
MRTNATAISCALIWITTITCPAVDSREPVEQSENGVWEKTKDLYEEGLRRGEEMFRRDTNETWKIVQKLYETAKENGEEVPKDVMEWAKQDIKKIGSWEYKIVYLTTTNPRHIETELNKYGSQRWECYWVEETKAGRNFYLKKAGRSYLRLIPAGDLLRLIPSGGADAS